MDLVMNTEAVMIGGKRVTFQKVEGSNGFFEDVADKKILKTKFPYTYSGLG
jgi:hypothetical protein